jgi:hypothetical protein
MKTVAQRGRYHSLGSHNLRDAADVPGLPDPVRYGTDPNPAEALRCLART